MNQGIIHESGGSDKDNSNSKGMITELEDSIEFSEKEDLTIKDIVKTLQKTFDSFSRKIPIKESEKTCSDIYKEKYEGLSDKILDGYLYMIYTGDKDVVKALAGAGFVKGYIDYCKESNVDPDFVSKSIYVKVGTSNNPICIDRLQTYYKADPREKK